MQYLTIDQIPRDNNGRIMGQAYMMAEGRIKGSATEKTAAAHIRRAETALNKTRKVARGYTEHSMRRVIAHEAGPIVRVDRKGCRRTVGQAKPLVAKSPPKPRVTAEVSDSIRKRIEQRKLAAAIAEEKKNIAANKECTWAKDLRRWTAEAAAAGKEGN